MQAELFCLGLFLGKACAPGSERLLNRVISSRLDQVLCDQVFAVSGQRARVPADHRGRTHQTGYAAGFPDILAIWQGATLTLKVKAPGKNRPGDDIRIAILANWIDEPDDWHIDQIRCPKQGKRSRVQGHRQRMKRSRCGTERRGGWAYDR